MTGEPLHYSFHQGPLTLSVQGGGAEGDRRIEARGRIDGATCHALRSVLLAEVEQGSVVLDGSAVEHCASSGVHVLLDAASAAAQHGHEFHVTPSSGTLIAAFGESAAGTPPNLFGAAETAAP
ncbi:MAG TPA: STAS domain-containing protein [Actinospica sp.]|jgi:anti-anti-sigma factor|nr:STAS domain-containing protein [Actinospica sp.]